MGKSGLGTGERGRSPDAAQHDAGAKARPRPADCVVPELQKKLGLLVRYGYFDSFEAVAAALKDVGLPADLAEYADSDRYDTELRASHKEGIDKVGQEVGTPVIAVPGADGEQVAFFGPVVTPAPKGEEAAKLWDGTLLVASIPGFYEMFVFDPDGLRIEVAYGPPELDPLRS